MHERYKIILNKFTLKYELDLDFILIAITCPLKDYRLTHFINKFTKIELAKECDYDLSMEKKSENLYFSMYHFRPDGFEVDFYLFSNRGLDGGFLIPELRTSDYLMVIKGFIDDEDRLTLVQDLNAIPDVLVAAEVFPDKLKSVENLIF